MIADGDKVVVRWRGEATHRGDFLGIPPTGRDAPMTGIAIYRLSEGRVVERWVEADLFGLTGRLSATAEAK
jgi:predicted ester cyclase